MILDGEAAGRVGSPPDRVFVENDDVDAIKLSGARKPPGARGAKGNSISLGNVARASAWFEA